MQKPKEIDYNFKVNHQKLWRLKLPVEEISIKELSFNLDIPYLEKEGTDEWNLSINELIINLEKENSHAKKMSKADTKYPIDIYCHRGNWIILDGVHRLAKLIYLGKKRVLVRRVPESAINKILS